MGNSYRLYFGDDFMAYRPLGKLYYGDRDAYTQAYRERFDSEDAVKLDFTVAGKQAFFLQNAEVMKLAYDVARLDKDVALLSAALPGAAKAQYSKKCLIGEIVLTNKIENVHSSRQEVDDALDILEERSAAKGSHNRFVGLVKKYLKLIAGEDIPLQTCRDIRAIYDEVFLQEVVSDAPQNAPDGEIFRKHPSAVHSATDKVIHRGLYPESEIIRATEQALAFLHNESVDRLCRVCIFHYLIEYIHPFYDGNGRIGRFILSYCLSDVLEPLLSYRISETIKENIGEYYRAFNTCNDPHNLGDLTPFLIMMLHMIRTSLEDLKRSLHRKQYRWRMYETLVDSFPECADENVAQMYSYLIQAALFSEKGISTKELEGCFKQSYYNVKKYLGFVRPALLRSMMKGRVKYYRLDLAQLDNMLLEKETKSP